MIYPNGVTVSAKSMKKLEKISDDPDSDRAFINTHFFVIFPEKYLEKQLEKGCSREKVLSKFRDSKRYDILKGKILQLRLKIMI